MDASRKRGLSEYPRPWFYRPEVYYGFIIFPPVWSVLTLRSPWHKGEGFLGIMVGGLAWFFLIATVVMTVKWVQADDDGNRHILNLFPFVPGVLLTLLTQVQWAAHRARHGPPPTESNPTESSNQPESSAPSSPSASAGDPETGDRESLDSPEGGVPGDGQPGTRRRRRRRRRPITRSADSTTLC